METLRSDFGLVLAELRRAVASIAGEAASRKALDEAQCVDRILGRLEAEACYRREHIAERQALLDAVVAELGAVGGAEAAILTRDYAALQARDWPSPDARLQECRTLLQARLPQLADGEGAGHALAALVRVQQAEDAGLREIASRIAPPTVADGKPPAGGAHPLSLAELEAYLRDAFPAEPALAVEEVAVIPGGRSKETSLISLNGVRGLPQRVVMRRDIPGGLVPSRAADEHAIIQVARSHGVPAPEPLHCEADPTRLGGTALIMAVVPGETKGEYFPEVNGKVPGDQSIGRQLAQILARLHRIDPAAFHGAHLNSDKDARTLAAETIEATYREACSFDAPPRLGIEVAYRWLKRSLHFADDELRLIHCDVGLHNMLIDDGKITALLDWELATFSSPAREIAKILHLIDYLMPREMFYRAYVEAGGPPGAVEPDRLNFYAVMNYMVTNQRARLASHLFFTGRQRNIVMANAGYDFWSRNEILLSNALKAAGAVEL